MINNSLFTSDSDSWATPKNFFEYLDSIYHFTLDPCSDETNFKCKKHYTKEQNGLLMKWDNERVFMNPPYGKEIKLWVHKAYSQSKSNNAFVVCLLPARTDTKYFHEYCTKSSEIIFIKGRLQFNDIGKSAPFPSMIVIFDGKHFEPKLNFLDSKVIK